MYGVCFSSFPTLHEDPSNFRLTLYFSNHSSADNGVARVQFHTSYGRLSLANSLECCESRRMWKRPSSTREHLVSGYGQSFVEDSPREIRGGGAGGTWSVHAFRSSCLTNSS